MASKWKKRFKKHLARAGKIISYAAPIAGGLFLGPLGAAAGTAAGAALRGATTQGNRRAKFGAVKKAAIFGGAVVAGTAALGLVSGSGLGSSVIGSVGKLIGGGETNSVLGKGGDTESGSVLGDMRDSVGSALYGRQTGAETQQAGMGGGMMPLLLIGGAALILSNRKAS